MTYNVTIKDPTGNEIIGHLTFRAGVTPAQHFTGCVRLAIDALNGLPMFNDIFRRESMTNEYLDNTRAHLLALPAFIRLLKMHPAFTPEQLEQSESGKRNLNRITLLENMKIQYRSDIPSFIKTLSSFEVEGVHSINISNSSPLNQQTLDNNNFPADMIPDDYLCALSMEIMDTPCYDPRSPNTKYEKKVIAKHIAEKQTNPHTNVALTESDLAIDQTLQTCITDFVTKVTLVREHFNDSENYAQFQAEIADSKITPDALKNKLATANNSSTATSGIFSNTNTNPKLKQIYDQYKLPYSEQPKNLEQLLRRTASEGDSPNLNYLLNLKNNLDVNAQDDKKYQRTALHWVAIRSKERPKKEKNYQHCTQLLLKFGANPTITDKEGNTPMYYLDSDSEIEKQLNAHLFSPPSSTT